MTWDRFGGAWCAYRSAVVMERHGMFCKPGLWRVGILFWGSTTNAVVDDFGNLVQVYA